MTEVRHAELSDLDVAAPPFEGYLHSYDRAHPQEAVGRFLPARSARNDSIVFLAFADAARAVGTAQVHPIPSSLSLASAWLLDDFSTDPSARGGGHGRAFLRPACSQAGDSGGFRIHWSAS